MVLTFRSRTLKIKQNRLTSVSGCYKALSDCSSSCEETASQPISATEAIRSGDETNYFDRASSIIFAATISLVSLYPSNLLLFAVSSSSIFLWSESRWRFLIIQPRGFPDILLAPNSSNSFASCSDAERCFHIVSPYEMKRLYQIHGAKVKTFNPYVILQLLCLLPLRAGRVLPTLTTLPVEQSRLLFAYSFQPLDQSQ